MGIGQRHLHENCGGLLKVMSFKTHTCLLHSGGFIEGHRHLPLLWSRIKALALKHPKNMIHIADILGLRITYQTAGNLSQLFIHHGCLLNFKQRFALHLCWIKNTTLPKKTHASRSVLFATAIKIIVCFLYSSQIFGGRSPAICFSSDLKSAWSPILNFIFPEIPISPGT